MKDFSDVQYELAVRIASRNIPVFTRVHSAVFASGAVTCILLVFLFFSTAIHIVSAFDFYRVQFARITGNYEERMMTVTESVPPQKNGGTYRIIFGEGSQRFSFNYLIYTPEAGEREVICYDRSSPEYAYPKNIYAIGEIVYDSVGSGSFALLVLAVLLFFQYPRYRLLSRLRRKGLYLKVREDEQYETSFGFVGRSYGRRYAPVYSLKIGGVQELKFRGSWTKIKPDPERDNYEYEFRIYMFNPDDPGDQRYFLEINRITDPGVLGYLKDRISKTADGKRHF